ARAGDRKSMQELLALLPAETNALWRAVSVNLLKRWTGDRKVSAALLSSLADPDPLVRSMSVRALESLAQTAAPATALRHCLEDPVRGVRMEAAWALRGGLDTNSTAFRDLLAHLNHNADEPAGKLQLGVFWLD